MPAKLRPDPPPSPFALFVRAVQGHVVRRFGSPTNIGVTIDGDGPHWDTETVHALTQQEAATYRAEYDRAIREGALLRVDEKAWRAWTEDRARRKQAARSFFDGAAERHAKAIRETLKIAADVALTEADVARWAEAAGIDPTSPDPVPQKRADAPQAPKPEAPAAPGDKE